MGLVTDTKTALNIPAVSACVDFISGTVARLPIRLYRENDGKTSEITCDIRLQLLNDSTGDLLDPYQMKKAFVRDYLLSGAGYIFPERRRNEFVSLRYIANEHVTFTKNYDPIYKTALYQIGTRTFYDDEIMRICRNTNDGVTGIGIIEEHPDILNAAYKQIVYERYLVERGGNKKGFIQVDDRVTQEVLDDLKEKWKTLYSSDNSNMMILNKGLKFVESSNTSVEMQLNESKDTNNELICQIFGLSSKVISGTANDDEYISAIKTAVMPVVSAIETALNRSMLLWSEMPDHYFTLDTKELLKGDILKRYQAYQIALHEGFLQVDEVRYEEDKEPFNLNWIKLGLQDVLFDTKNHTIYTPNTNQTVKFGEFSIDKQNGGGIIEERGWVTINGKHVFIGEDGGGSGGGKASGSEKKPESNANNGKVKQIGTVDFNNKQAVKEIIYKSEKEFSDLPYEKCRTVTSDGKIWDVTGTSGTVDNSGIEAEGSSLVGSYSYHNHSKNETYFSFSGEDAADFISNGEAISMASDYKYRYVMERTSDTKMGDYNAVKHDFNYLCQTDVYQKAWNGEIDFDFDGYHETIKLLSKKYHFNYRRVLKEDG